jgi:hypothetical protein
MEQLLQHLGYLGVFGIGLVFGFIYSVFFLKKFYIKRMFQLAYNNLYQQYKEALERAGLFQVGDGWWHRCDKCGDINMVGITEQKTKVLQREPRSIIKDLRVLLNVFRR